MAVRGRVWSPHTASPNKTSPAQPGQQGHYSALETPWTPMKKMIYKRWPLMTKELRQVNQTSLAKMHFKVHFSLQIMNLPCPIEDSLKNQTKHARHRRYLESVKLMVFMTNPMGFLWCCLTGISRSVVGRLLEVGLGTSLAWIVLPWVLVADLLVVCPVFLPWVGSSLCDCHSCSWSEARWGIVLLYLPVVLGSISLGWASQG